MKVTKKNRAKIDQVKKLERINPMKSDVITYFKKTEKLLYSYRDLRMAVKQKEEDIKFLQENGLQQKSKSIVFYNHNQSVALSGADQYVEILEGYQAAKERTERLIIKIERALDEIKDDRYYCIIEAKYFEKMTNLEIEQNYNVSESTIRRHKNRLVNKLEVLLFGADALTDF